MTNDISFEVEELERISYLEPHVDGRALSQMILDFEMSRGFKPAGGYAGIVPAHHKFGDLTEHFLGGQFAREGKSWVLGCDCGENGCWPLTAEVTATDHSVTWSHFSQDHRPERDYSGFGPFVFDRAQFEIAVAEGVRKLATKTA